MTELLDKLERARFLAVIRMSRRDAESAELLDKAFIFEAESDGGITLHLTQAAGQEREYEIDLRFAESATEEELAAFLTLLLCR